MVIDVASIHNNDGKEVWHHYGLGNARTFETQNEAKESMDKVLIECGWEFLPDKLKVLL